MDPQNSSCEGNLETSQASTSQLSDLLQSAVLNISSNEKINETSNEKVSVSSSNSCNNEYSSTNCHIAHLPEHSKNLNCNNGSNLNSPSKTSKKKNAKKKERLEKLQIEMANDNKQPETIQTAPAAPTQNGTTSVHDFFLKYITPLYPSANSRYLENRAHHPQYFLMQNVHFGELYHNHQIAANLPNSPFLQQPHPSNSQNALFHYTPPFHHYNHPKYLQNALQHPLLNKNLVHTNHHNFQQASGIHPLITSSTFINSQITQNEHVSQHTINNSPRQRNSSKKKDVSDNEERQFSPYLSIEEVEKGLQDDSLLEGVLRINPRQFQHSYVSSADKSQQDVLIDGVKNRNRALEGDIVIIQYIEDDSEENKTNGEEKQKKGKVVFIKEKFHTRLCIGNLKLMPDKSRQRALFVPRDYRVPRLNIPFTNWPNNFYTESKSYENTLFLAKIEEWNDVRFAKAKIICQIGQSGDMETETKAILAQTDLDITPFGPEVRQFFPNSDYIIPEAEISLRKDCRNMCIFSIDPFSCRDVDDAISCERLSNGNFEIGVHISDVAHFLAENTILDKKVAEKATTIYMVERAYHMLPDELCMLCSLSSGVDKLAFSIFWEMTEDAQVVRHTFAKTVIHCCGQLAYENAQAVLDNNENAESTFPELYNGFSFKDIEQRIKKLGELSAILRERRFEGGALKLDQPKVSFHLNPANGLPESFLISYSKTSHQLIEEFMLLANITVAHRIYDDHPTIAFLRSHPPPSVYMLKQLAKSLKPMGINLEINSAGELNKSLLPYVGSDSTDKGRVMVLNMLCAKPMARAKYFCAGGPEDDYSHYALNVPLYTHFTSPIRRYADVMVHRLLAASLQYRETPQWEEDVVSMIAAQCNKQKYNAKKAGELSTKLYILKYIELNTPVITEAVVVEIREKYIDVIVVSMGLNRRIFFNSDFPGEYECIKSDAGIKLSKMKLTWMKSDDLPNITQMIEVFSLLQIEMHKGDDLVKVETKLVRPQCTNS